MRREDIQDLFKIAGWRAHERTGWVATECPFAESRHGAGRDDRPSFGISVHDDNDSWYNCFACGSKGILSTLPTTLRFVDGISDKMLDKMAEHINRTETFSDQPYVDTLVLTDAPSLHEDILKRFRKIRRSHLKKRGVKDDSVYEFDLKLDSEENRIVYPVRDKHSRIVGVRGRFLGDADAMEVCKYREYIEFSPTGGSVKRFGIWYGENNIPDPSKATVLVEGEFDLILMRQQFQNMNILASMGPPSGPQIKALEKFSKGVICFFDNDAGGRNCLGMIRDNLDGKIPLYRITEYFGENDPGDLYRAGKLVEAFKTGLKRI
jgi:hypothetical protein